ncbi:MAG: hypothetical protein JW716_05470 [Candidatus Aenigmarchaeota archaeon]|nr:hypothetical protein [Candidatus Aenigmarchaeota archaeon]
MKKRIFNFIYPHRENKMKKYIPAFIMVIALTVLMTFIIYDATMVYERFEIPMKLRIRTDGYVGINTDTDSINFGSVPRGGTGERLINVTNGDENPHLVRIKSRGQIGEWVSVSDNNFILNPGSVKEVRVKAKTSPGVMPGNYTGTLEIVFENVLG